MKRSRKPYLDEFKHEAVRRLMKQRLSRSQVARGWGIDPETLRRCSRSACCSSRPTQLGDVVPAHNPTVPEEEIRLDPYSPFLW